MSKKNTIEFRYYDMNPGNYIFALLGETWIREYGYDIDVQHFHNYLKIGLWNVDGGSILMYTSYRNNLPSLTEIICGRYYRSSEII